MNYADPNARFDALRAEADLLRRWYADGTPGARPATPLFDEIDRSTRHDNQGETAMATEKKSRLDEARAKSKEGPRGKGNPMDDDALAAWIRNERKTTSEITRHQAHQINWWVDGFSVGGPRFTAMWNHVVEGGDAPAPKPTPKPKTATSDAKENGSTLTRLNAEKKAEKEWLALPEADRGPRPETPLLDKTRADYEAKEAKAQAARDAKATKTVTPRPKKTTAKKTADAPTETAEKTTAKKAS